MNNILLYSTILYFGLSIILGFFGNRSLTYEKLLVNKRGFGGFAIALSLIGTVIGGGMFFAVSQAGYEAGTAILALPFSYILGYFLFFKISKKITLLLERESCGTLYDLIYEKLSCDSKTMADMYILILSLINCGMYFFMLAGQFTILANFYIGILEMERWVAWLMSLAVGGLITFVYAITGGVRKDILTDIFQVPLVLCGVILIAFSLFQGNYINFNEIPIEHWIGTGYGTFFPIAVILFFSPSFISRFDYWQRLFATRSIREFRKALVITLPFIFFGYLVFCILGLSVYSQIKDLPSTQAGLHGLKMLFSGGTLAIILISFYSAIIASSDTLLTVATVSAERITATLSKIRKKVFVQSVKRFRVTAIFISILASISVILAADTIELIIAGFSSLVILAPSIAYILLSPNPSSKFATLSLFFGYIFFIFIFTTFPALRKSAFVIGFFISCMPIGFTILINKIINFKIKYPHNH